MPKIEKYLFPSDSAAETLSERDRLSDGGKEERKIPKKTALHRQNAEKTTVFAKAKNNFLHFANILDKRQKKWLNNYKVVILRSMRNFY